MTSNTRLRDMAKYKNLSNIIKSHILYIKKTNNWGLKRLEGFSS